MKHLSVQIAEHGLRYAYLDETNPELKELLFSDKKDHNIKEELNDFFEKNNLKNSQIDECTVSWSCFKSTLIPSIVFSESSPSDLFKLCYGSNFEKNNIDYNRIPEQGIVNLYEIPLWVKSYFVLKFPRSIIQHEGSNIIRGIFASASFKLRSLLTVYHNYFLLAIVKENKLQFYGVFDFQNSDDIIYHFLFVLQQKDWFGNEMMIDICGGVGSENIHIIDLIDKLKRFQEFKNVEIANNTSFLTNSHKFCV